KSGSPAPKPITGRPAALRALALASTARVADSAIEPMRCEMRGRGDWVMARAPAVVAAVLRRGLRRPATPHMVSSPDRCLQRGLQSRRVVGPHLPALVRQYPFD